MKLEGIAGALLGGVLIGFSASVGFILANKVFKKGCDCQKDAIGTSNYSGVIPRETNGWYNASEVSTPFSDGTTIYKYN
jgi:hypothetical protein